MISRTKNQAGESEGSVYEAPSIVFCFFTSAIATGAKNVRFENNFFAQHKHIDQTSTFFFDVYNCRN